MTSFNLLPSEYRKKPATIRRILLFVILALLLLPITKYGFLKPIQNKMEALQQLELLKEKAEDYTDLEEVQLQQQFGLEELEQRILAFQEMEEGTPRYWNEAFDTLIKTLPHNSHLNHFTCDSNTILLAGTCKSDRTSVAYMRNLKDSGSFSEVHMEKIVYQQNGEVQFTIKCILHFDTIGELSYEPV